MSKATLAILYIATILTVFAPTVELVRGTILPGLQTLTSTLEEVAQ
jgi:hypothetical protein